MPTPPPPPPPPPPPAWPPPRPDHTLAVVAHLGGLLAGFLAPLVVYLVSDRDPLTREQARQALNFQLSFMIWSFIGWLLILVLIGLLVLPVLFVLWFACTIAGAVHAGRGEVYRYPLTLNLVS